MKIQTSWWRQRLIACDEISPTWEAPWDKPCLMYLDASVGAGQLGELDAAAVVHVPQTHLSENNGRNSKPSTSIKTSSESLLASWFSIWMILVQTAAAWVLRSTFSPKAAFQLFSCFVFECKKKTHPLSDALTMYCLSLHALALDRQVMEAVWPNNMARGQIWTEDKRREFSFSFFTILRRKTWQKYEKSSRTSSSGVMSHRQIWPSWQPVMMVLKSSITSRLLMQCVGAVRPHSTMGRTRLFPDMMPTRLKRREQFWRERRSQRARHKNLELQRLVNAFPGEPGGENHTWWEEGVTVCAVTAAQSCSLFMSLLFTVTDRYILLMSRRNSHAQYSSINLLSAPPLMDSFLMLSMQEAQRLSDLQLCLLSAPQCLWTRQRHIPASPVLCSHITPSTLSSAQSGLLNVDTPKPQPPLSPLGLTHTSMQPSSSPFQGRSPPPYIVLLLLPALTADGIVHVIYF